MEKTQVYHRKKKEKLAPARKNESKSARFERLAVPRVNGALKALRLVEQLANPLLYDFSESQSNEVIGALEKSLDAVKLAYGERLKAKQGRGAKPFTLKAKQ